MAKQQTTMKLKVIPTPYNGINLLAAFQMGYETNLMRHFMFTQESKYETKNPKDQSDWNKLTGLASYKFNSQKSSHMWAWRYYEGNFEIAPYSHDADGNKILPKESEITIIPINTKFTLWIVPDHRKDGKQVLFEVRIGERYQQGLYLEVKHEQSLLLNFNDKYRVITTWFGGTSLPKKIVKIYGES
jgi:hypothetical protein